MNIHPQNKLAIRQTPFLGNQGIVLCFLVGAMAIGGGCRNLGSDAVARPETVSVLFNWCPDWFQCGEDQEYVVIVQPDSRFPRERELPTRLFVDFADRTDYQRGAHAIADAFGARCWMNERFAVIGRNLHDGRVEWKKGVLPQDCPELDVVVYRTCCDHARLSDVAALLNDCLAEALGENHKPVLCEESVLGITMTFYRDESLRVGDWLELVSKLCPVNVFVKSDQILFVSGDGES
jgi:hypothetical protein